MKGMVHYMENKPEVVVFTSDAGEEVVFQVIEQTRLGEIDYLLVSMESDNEEEEEEAFILKDISEATEEDAVYDIVEDEQELDMVAAIFQELLGDDIELL